MPVAPPSDLDLIQATLAGDHAPFKILVERYEGQIARTVVGMLGNGPEAEDVGQEVFIRFYRSLAKFRGEAAVSTYLTRIAINLSLNALQKRKRRKLFRFGDRERERDFLDQIPDHELTQVQRDTQALVQQALQMVPTKYRTVLVLRMIEGYSTQETASLLSLPLGTVLSRLSRGQQKLKELLTGMEGIFD